MINPTAKQPAGDETSHTRAKNTEVNSLAGNTTK